jgi:hypothetical protein
VSREGGGGEKPVKPRCVNCRFWEVFDGEGTSQAVGSCRRYAPQPRAMLPEDTVPGELDGTVWPTTALDDWCGDVVIQLNSKG